MNWFISWLVPSRLSLCLSLVARGVWWEGGKRGRESSSLFPSHHPLFLTRALREDDWGLARFISEKEKFMQSLSSVTNFLSFKKNAVWFVNFFFWLTVIQGIQDSLEFWILRRGFRIQGTGFQFLSVKLWCCILNVRGIPNSLSFIQESKAQDSGFYKQKFSAFRKSTFPLKGAIHYHNQQVYRWSLIFTFSSMNLLKFSSTE